VSKEEVFAPVSPDVASSSDNDTAAHRRTLSRREKREKKRKAAAATAREVETSREKETMLATKLVELQRRIRTYGKT